jgi:prolyl oligopeptidase PreP (S9A serine peptidase family)
VWLISQEFTSATTTTGGPGDDFRGVFEDDLQMDLVTSSPATVMRISPNQAYFTGADGVQVDGLSDDVTLTSQGYTTSSARTSRRRALTANRVIVSTSVDDVPVNHEYAVTYVVSDDSGVKNIEVGAVSYPALGSLDFTFDDDKKKVPS